MSGFLDHAPRQDAAAAVVFGSLAEAIYELWHSPEEVGDQAVVGRQEDRRLVVLVDRYDDLRVLHACQGAGSRPRIQCSGVVVARQGPGATAEVLPRCSWKNASTLALKSA